ncbi:MAG: hypothetical protein LBM00_02690, partial [Deltaproteobacteria bacterium]|nr:hypothetical protein [Deltaproteobacteria bacterium]
MSQYNFEAVDWSKFGRDDYETMRLMAAQDEQLIDEELRRNNAPGNALYRGKSAGELFDLTYAEKDPGLHYLDDLGVAYQLRKEKSPEEIFETTHLAKGLGISYSEAENHKNELVRAYRAKIAFNDPGLRKLIAESPDFRKFFTNLPAPEQAAIADDKALWLVEKNQRGFLEDIEHSWRFGEKQQERLALGNLDAEARASDEQLERMVVLEQQIETNSALREGESTGDWAVRTMVENLPQYENMAALGLYRAGQGAIAGGTTGALLGSVVPGMGTAA